MEGRTENQETIGEEEPKPSNGMTVRELIPEERNVNDGKQVGGKKPR